MEQNKSGRFGWIQWVSITLSVFTLVLVTFSFITILQLARSSDEVSTVTANLNDFFTKVAPDYREIASGERAAGNSGAVAAAPTEVVDIDLGDDPQKGSDDATVTIVEYSDYQCPYCSRFVQTTYKQILGEYVDTGKVRLIFKDFPIINSHPLALPAAQLGNCIQDRFGDDRYFEYHDLVFEPDSQDKLSGNRQQAQANLNAMASTFGLTEGEIQLCLDSKETEDEVLADLDEGSSLGVTGTPTFFINGRKIVGARPFEDFKRIIDEELSS